MVSMASDLRYVILSSKLFIHNFWQLNLNPSTFEVNVCAATSSILVQIPVAYSISFRGSQKEKKLLEANNDEVILIIGSTFVLCSFI